MIDSMVNCLIIAHQSTSFPASRHPSCLCLSENKSSELSKDEIAEFLNNTQPHSKIANFYAVLSPSWPAKTSVSPRSSLLGAFRAEERFRLNDGDSILMT